MSSQSPREVKWEIKESPGIIEIEFSYREPPGWGTIIIYYVGVTLVFVWLLGWINGFIDEFATHKFNPYQFFAFIAGLMIGLFILAMLLAGRERVVVKGEELILSRGPWGRGFSLSVPITKVRNLRVSRKINEPEADGSWNGLWEFDLGVVAFDYDLGGGESVGRFGFGLSDVEAEKLISAIGLRFPSMMEAGREDGGASKNEEIQGHKKD